MPKSSIASSPPGTWQVIARDAAELVTGPPAISPQPTTARSAAGPPGQPVAQIVPA